MFIKEMKDIEISKIKSFKNVRGDAGDVHNLMSSMKQNGQLQPIGIVPNGKDSYKLCWGNRRIESAIKLGWSKIKAVILDKEMSELEFDTLNYTENEHRSNPTSADRGRYYHEMMNKYNMTKSELSARLQIPKSRIQDGLIAFNFTPDEFKDKIAPFMAGREPKKGQIPASYITKLNTIINRHKLNKYQQTLLYNFARQDNVSKYSLDAIGYFLAQGDGINEAIEKTKKYDIIWFKVPIPKKEINEYLKKHKITKKQLGLDVFRGDTRVRFNVPKWKMK